MLANTVIMKSRYKEVVDDKCVIGSYIAHGGRARLENELELNDVMNICLDKVVSYIA